MTATIRPGTYLVDDRGQVAQLHGIGSARVGDRWFAWGEDKTRGDRFHAVACYSTDDLATWRYEGDALTIGGGDIGADRIVERPKVLQHPKGHWVMFLHIDTADYSAARVGYAVAENPQGPYGYLHSERPLGNISRDIGVYQEDGVGYLLSEDRANGLHIYQLTADYLSVESTVMTLRQRSRPEFGYESPALVKHEGLYYLLGSDMTGWSLNDNQYATAPDLAGPWSDWADIAPRGSATFQSQVSTVVPLGDGRFAYVGDRWQPEDLYHSPVVILPLQLHAARATLEWTDAWRLDELNPTAN
jgi:hypothetical protein